MIDPSIFKAFEARLLEGVYRKRGAINQLRIEVGAGAGQAIKTPGWAMVTLRNSQ
jgi:hypothetical protein